MECKDISKWVCAYLDNELDPEMKEIFERHIVVCSSCRKEMEACKSIKFLIQKKISSAKAPDILRSKIIIELSRIDEYRETGIDVIDLLRWGSHIAQLYEGKDEIPEVVAPYMVKGLEQNELCLWIVSDISKTEARDAIMKALPSVESYLDNGQLEILSYEDWYLVGGRFDGQLVLNESSKKCQDAISNGYSGLRVAGNTCWLERHDWDSFINFEELMNSNISDQKLLAVCSYKQDGCAKNMVGDVIRTHKYVICKSEHSWRLKRSTISDQFIMNQ